MTIDTETATPVRIQQFADAARAWLTSNYDYPGFDGESVADVLDIDDTYGEQRDDQPTDWLIEVDRLMVEAESVPELQPWLNGVSLWLLSDREGVTDGYLLTVDTTAGEQTIRVAPSYEERVGTLAHRPVFGVDAAVDALAVIVSEAEPLRAQAMPPAVAAVLADYDQWDITRKDIAHRAENGQPIGLRAWEDSDETAQHLVHAFADAVRPADQTQGA